MSKRVNGFTASTRRTVAARAGHKCSFPDCGKSTSGPSRDSARRSLENGWACHIYPASPGGPRSELTPAGFQLDSIQNAIWMCETHGALIDKNKGLDYPPRLLLKWRDQAESYAATAQTSSVAHAPSIDLVIIEKSQDNNQHFEFEKVQIELFRFTVIYSRESYALSMVCTSIAKALKHPEEAIFDLAGQSLSFQIRFADPNRSAVRVSYGSQGVLFWEDNRSVVSIEGIYEAILVNNRSILDGIAQTPESRFPESDNRTVSERELLISGDSILTQKLAERLKDEDNVMTEDIRLTAGQWLVRSNAHELGQYFDVGSLSSSEQLSVHLDLTIAALRIKALRSPDSPFLLILDNVLWRYDKSFLDRFVSVCDRLPLNVQVLVTDSSERVADHLPNFRLNLISEKKSDSPGFLFTECSQPAGES